MESNGKVTRMEIAGKVRDAFGAEAVDRDGLLAAANRNGARLEVIQVLQALPKRRFRELRDLWEELGDLPVG